MTKLFDANRGLQLDKDFTEHARDCRGCKQFDPKKPATSVHLCLEGAVLWKRDNVKAPKRPRVERGEFFATKSEMKRVTRYRGE